MTTSGFDPEISNANLNAAQYYIDDDGALKFVSPYISSSNFDGTIPVVETTINAENIEPGMLLQVDAGEYLPVISVSYDDVDLESSPSSTITIGYVDSNNELNTIDYNFTDSVDVRYEDWANKDLGNQGWSITSGGNAIFANVGVRGDLEATTLDVGGDTGITYDGTSVVIGASVIINAPVTFNGSSSYVTFNDLSASYALQSYVETVNNRLSASISSVSSSVSRLVINDNILSASITNLYNAGFVTDTDLITNGATTITGNNITTGVINANLVNVSSGLTGNRGIKINSLGLFAYDASSNQTLSIDSNTGNLTAKGTIQATSGYFGSSTNNWSVGEETVSGTLTAYMKSGTLKLYTQNISGVQHGQITLYNTDSTTFAGSLSNALSNTNKTIRSLQTGLHIGTVDDYLFIPGIGNTTVTRSRFRGSALDFYNTSDLFRIRLNNSGLNIGSDAVINFFDTAENVGAYIDYAAASDTLLIDNGGAAGGVVNVRASDLQLNGVSVAGGGGGGGGVTSFKFGDTGPTETGAVSITGAEIITAINNNSIENAKLTNKGITIMSTTRNLGGSFIAGDIDGDVITANTLPPGKINNGTNLISIGTTGIPARSTINGINGLSTLQVTGAQGLDYTFNLGTTQINLNRSQQALGATLGGVNISGSAAQLNNTTSLIGTTWGAQGGIIYNNNGILAGIGTGTTGQFLRSNGTSAPSWQNIDAMVNPMTAIGDLIYGGTVDLAGKATPTRIAVGGTGAILRVSGGIPSWLGRGTANQVLRVNSGGTDIEWGTLSFMTNPMTAVGDIIYGGTSGAPTRLPAGSNGQFLQYSTTNNRPTWVTFSSLANPMTAAGQMIYGSTSGTPAAVAAGSSGQVLVSGGAGAPSFTSTLSGITLNPTISIGITGNASTGNVLVKANSGAMLLGGTNIGSTIKIKENIQDLVNYESIYNLNPVTFYLKKEHQLSSAIETASVQIGFIAEEIAKILPEAVQYYPDSNEIWNYSDRAILAVAVKAIQEQKNIIDSLQNKLLDLEARLDAAGL